MRDGGELRPMYVTRVEPFISFRDPRNHEGMFEAICELLGDSQQADAQSFGVETGAGSRM